MEPKLFNCTIGNFHKGSEVGRIHVSLPKVAGFPVFVEQKVGWIFVVLVQVVLNAASFFARDGNELFQLSFNEVNFVGVGEDVAGDGELGHGYFVG